MREKILCSRCRKEFDSAQEIVTPNGDVICSDCMDDVYDKDIL